MITREQLREDLQRRYNDNKMMIVGATCYCPICHKPFEKKTVHQVFCGSSIDTHCKDAYHNFMRYGTLYPQYKCFNEVYNHATYTDEVKEAEFETYDNSEMLI